jgi:hypothetical protein
MKNQRFFVKSWLIVEILVILTTWDIVCKILLFLLIRHMISNVMSCVDVYEEAVRSFWLQIVFIGKNL